MKKLLVMLMVVCMLSSLVACGSKGSAAPTGANNSKSDYSDENVDNSADEIKVDPNVSMSKKNAVKAAYNYLKTMPFSYLGLIDQLEYEEYTHEDAVYAVDNCGADWKEQALKKAKSYLRSMAFSYSGLIEQLEYEKYTAEEAKYGADNCGADWKEQAAKKAKDYLDTMPFSRGKLIDQLEYEGFTTEQAEYGVNSVGL